MNNNWTIRMAHEDDIDEIMAIEMDCFSLEICEEQSVFLERINVFSDGFYVIDYGGKVIGYISTELWEYKEEVEVKDFTLGHAITHTHKNYGDEIYISSMGVLSKFRGQGLGRILFQEAIDRILDKNRNIKSQILIVSEQWDSARRIYKKNGFKEVLTIREFFEYKSNYKENGIIMRKNIISKKL